MSGTPRWLQLVARKTETKDNSTRLRQRPGLRGSFNSSPRFPRSAPEDRDKIQLYPPWATSGMPTSGSSGAASQVSPTPASRKRPRAERQRPDVTYPRKRAITACSPCRSKKVKCNNARPTCSACADADPAACVYNGAADYSSFDPASIAILGQLGEVLALLRGQGGQPPPSKAAGQGPTSTPTLTQDQHRLHAVGPGVGTLEMALNDLSIPAGMGNAESVLAWPIFADRFPPTSIFDELCEAELAGHDEADADPAAAKAERARGVPNPRAAGVNEQDVPGLVRRYLDFVHIRDPILDAEKLVSMGQQVAEDGFTWDAVSCLVLIVCALGSLAKRYEPVVLPLPTGRGTSLETDRDNLIKANAYFSLARRRFGILEKGIITCQCHFLAGVYFMTTMNPMQACSRFDEASRRYFAYFQCQLRRAPGAVQPRQRRSFEQRLYWSCYKAETELRFEMNVPSSVLADLDYPDDHPSPPDFKKSSVGDVETGLLPLSQDQTLRCTQERGWYCYLTEISLRRIVNRVLNLFYRDGPSSWNPGSILLLAKTAREFEGQMEDWSKALPPAFRPDSDEFANESELSFIPWGRLRELKTLIYRPFLYYAIHNSRDAPHMSTVRPFVEKAMDCALGFDLRTCRHRHHGTWYHIRALFTTSLYVLAAAKSGNVTLPPTEHLRAELQSRLDVLYYWRDEMPGVSRAIHVLETLLKEL